MVAWLTHEHILAYIPLYPTKNPMKPPFLAEFLWLSHDIQWYFHDIFHGNPHLQIFFPGFFSPRPPELGRCHRRRWASSRAVRETSCAASRSFPGDDGMDFFFWWFLDAHGDVVSDFDEHVGGDCWDFMCHMWEIWLDWMVKHLDFSSDFAQNGWIVDFDFRWDEVKRVAQDWQILAGI